MSGETEAYVRLLAQSTEAFVWLVLALVCLGRARGNPWAALGALGATLLFVPATTATAIGVATQLFDSLTMYANFLRSPLPTAYPVLQVAGAVLLLTAVVAGRGGRSREQVAPTHA